MSLFEFAASVVPFTEVASVCGTESPITRGHFDATIGKSTTLADILQAIPTDISVLISHIFGAPGFLPIGEPNEFLRTYIALTNRNERVREFASICKKDKRDWEEFVEAVMKFATWLPPDVLIDVLDHDSPQFMSLIRDGFIILEDVVGDIPGIPKITPAAMSEVIFRSSISAIESLVIKHARVQSYRDAFERRLHGYCACYTAKFGFIKTYFNEAPTFPWDNIWQFFNLNGSPGCCDECCDTPSITLIKHIEHIIYVNGEEWARIHYHNGFTDGVFMTPTSMYTYRHGQRHGKFSRVIDDWVVTGNYRKGKRHGTFKATNDEFVIIGSCYGGNLFDRLTCLCSNGDRLYIRNFDNEGRYDGKHRHYHEDKLCATTYYAHGVRYAGKTKARARRIKKDNKFSNTKVFNAEAFRKHSKLLHKARPGYDALLEA